MSVFSNIANTLQCLEEQFPRDFVWYDCFHHKLRTKGESGALREWTENDTLNLTIRLQREFGHKRVSQETVLSAVRAYASERERNEVREWMNALAWDCVARIETFFHEGMGADDTAYARAASRNFWIAMAARVYKPDCKFDNLPIFEGPQGTLKSTALSIIGGPWYADVSESIESKDFSMTFHGKLLIEISELQAFSKGSVNLLKKTLSTQVDRYRPPYARATHDFPRHCILAGTTNDVEYLKDPTGARRFWPIRTGKIDVDYIRSNRELLFAEAVDLFKAGASWWEMPLAETQAEQDARREQDPWETPLLKWLSGLSEISTGYLLEKCFLISPSAQTHKDKLRVASVLRANGWEPGRGSDSRTRTRIWRRTSDDSVTSDPFGHPRPLSWHAFDHSDQCDQSFLKKG